MTVAEMRGWGHLTGASCKLSEDDAYAIQQANAAFIVRACNAHDALVAACESPGCFQAGNFADGLDYLAESIRKVDIESPDLTVWRSWLDAKADQIRAALRLARLEDAHAE